MEIKVHYDNLADRAEKVKENEGQKLRMLHDDFDSDWVRGDEPHGTMTFTDKQPPTVEPKLVRDLTAEIDKLKVWAKTKGYIEAVE